MAIKTDRRDSMKTIDSGDRRYFLATICTERSRSVVDPVELIGQDKVVRSRVRSSNCFYRYTSALKSDKGTRLFGGGGFFSGSQDDACNDLSARVVAEDREGTRRNLSFGPVKPRDLDSTVDTFDNNDSG